MRHTWLHYFLFVHSASRIQCSVVTGMDCVFCVPGVICGYHVYQRLWTPIIGEKANTAREPGNKHDRYAIAMLEDQTLCTIGHIPREILKECFYTKRRCNSRGGYWSKQSEPYGSTILDSSFPASTCNHTSSYIFLIFCRDFANRFSNFALHGKNYILSDA